jgi:pimeloyl-ACP methyl ester carboxylesterase
MSWRLRDTFAWVSVVVLGFLAVSGVAAERPAPLMIQEQGSFAVGGTVVTAPGTFDPIRHGAYNPADQSVEGQTLHGDHAYVFYQIPVNPRPLPLVMWHGHGQSAKTWETTPDGREGFQTLFLRRRFPVYLVDQPRRGRASRSTVPMNLTAAPDEQLWYGIFRLGVWPSFFPGVQFSQNPEALDQFFRQMVPNTGPFDMDVNVAAVSALFDKIGPGILITLSQSGGPGWRTAMKDPTCGPWRRTSRAAASHSRKVKCPRAVSACFSRTSCA